MELTVFLTWIACLLSYFSSENQKLFDNSLNKRSAWGGFIVLLSIALWSAMQWHIAAIAAFYVLALVMTFWLVIVFMHGHISNKRFPSIITAVMFFSALSGAGGQYAA